MTPEAPFIYIWACAEKLFVMNLDLPCGFNTNFYCHGVGFVSCSLFLSVTWISVCHVILPCVLSFVNCFLSVHRCSLSWLLVSLSVSDLPRIPCIACLLVYLNICFSYGLSVVVVCNCFLLLSWVHVLLFCPGLPRLLN